MTDSNNQLIQTLQVALAQNEKISLAVLFGSYATGKIHAQSDIDLAIAFKHSLTMEEKIDLMTQLSQLTNKEVDIVDIRLATGVLLEQILKNRKTLINNDSELYGNIIAKRVTEESDFMPLLENMYKNRRERFHQG